MPGRLTNPPLSDTLLSQLATPVGGVNVISQVIGAIIGLIFIVAAIVFFFMLAIGGIQWLVSGGDKTAVESARGRITNALIGLVVTFSVFAIVKLIEFFFDTNILLLDITELVIG